MNQARQFDRALGRIDYRVLRQEARDGGEGRLRVKGVEGGGKEPLNSRHKAAAI
jgi:hypothetical protein